MSELKECPFDRSHHVSAKSFPLHIVKCQRQNPDIKLARCPLNASHLMKEEKLKEHVRTCPSRAEFDVYRYNVATMAANHISHETDGAEHPIINTGDSGKNTTGKKTLQDDSECWDDYSYQAYDPLNNCRMKKLESKSFIVPNPNQFVGKSVEAALMRQEMQNESPSQNTKIKLEFDSVYDKSFQGNEPDQSNNCEQAEMTHDSKTMIETTFVQHSMLAIIICMTGNDQTETISKAAIFGILTKSLIIVHIEAIIQKDMINIAKEILTVLQTETIIKKDMINITLKALAETTTKLDIIDIPTKILEEHVTY
ncbi:uncharacterized protein LOC128723770 [Anopheles nili]|uniref:uncharacterized protein LOC128723770 n=1 Tax=Anopheles nili TaxID=185578 RepID=UPI00237A9CF0|nr:uncharacterized protein LOC128723770 [Anopheles nili]